MISSSGVYASMMTSSGFVANKASRFGSPRVPTSVAPAGSVSAVSHRAKPSASATATGSTQSVNTSSVCCHSSTATRSAGLVSSTVRPNPSVSDTGPVAVVVASSAQPVPPAATSSAAGDADPFDVTSAADVPDEAGWVVQHAASSASSAEPRVIAV